MKKLVLPLITIMILVMGSMSLREVESKDFPQDYFRPPLGIPMLLTGTFGELRSNHFHAGIDVRTNNQIGYRIYAAADGYVSRVKVSPYGYGKALYITHPNGYTTVYGHLSRYNGALAEYIKAEQYRRETFAMDLYFKKDKFPVKKGDTVAFSGNSGGSQAPHLHFEIRDRQERPLNPLFFGFDIDDTVAPLIRSLLLNNLDDRSQRRKLKPKKRKRRYKVLNDTVTTAYKKVGFSVKAIDVHNKIDNKNGVYGLTVEKDDTTIYSFKARRIGFDETRYLNSHIDYALKQRGQGYYHRCFVQPGNYLASYPELKNRGIISQLDQKKGHRIKIHILDVEGNTSTMDFYLAYKPSKGTSTKTKDSRKKVAKVFPFKVRNTFLNEMIFLDFPPNAFYDTLHFEYDHSGKDTGLRFSPVHHIHHPYEPVHNAFKVFIKPQNLPDSLRHQALIVYQNQKGRIYSKKGQWKDEYLWARTKNLGDYFITVDTTAPKIKPFNIFDGKDLGYQNKIQLKISDDLSGIRTYRATLDGQWILMDYDAKNDMLTYLFDEKMTKGSHTFSLVITDGRNNKSRYTATLKN